MKSQGRYVDVEKKYGNLIITGNPDGLEFIREKMDDGETNIESSSFEHDLLESHLCNGWTEIRPEEIGALTSGLIITDDCVHDDDGKLTECGRVYWHERYQVESIAKVLLEGGTVTLLGRP